MKKKISLLIAVVLVLVLALTFALAGCGKNDDNGDNSGTETPNNTNDNTDNGDNTSTTPGSDSGDDTGTIPGSDPEDGTDTDDTDYTISAEDYSVAHSLYKKNFELYARNAQYTEHVVSLADGSVLTCRTMPDELDDWMAVRPQEDGTFSISIGTQQSADSSKINWTHIGNYTESEYLAGDHYMDFADLIRMIERVQFDDLTYDADTHAYTGTVADGKENYNVEFQFEKGLLVFAAFSSGDQSLDIDLSYGEATIDNWYGLDILDDDAIFAIVNVFGDCLNVTAAIDFNDLENEERIVYDVFKVQATQSMDVFKMQTDDVYYTYEDELVYKIRYDSANERWLASLAEDIDGLGLIDSLARKLTAAAGFTYDEKDNVYRYGHSGGEGFVRIENNLITEYYFKSAKLEINATFADYGTTQVVLPDYEVSYGSRSVLTITKRVPQSGQINVSFYQNSTMQLQSWATIFFDDLQMTVDQTDISSVKAKIITADGEFYYVSSKSGTYIISQDGDDWVAEERALPVLDNYFLYLLAEQTIEDEQLIRFGGYKDEGKDFYYYSGNGPVSIHISIEHSYVSQFIFINQDEDERQEYVYTDINDSELQLPAYSTK